MTWARYTVLASSSFNSQQPVNPSQGSVTATSLPVSSYRIASVQESSLPPQQRMSISNPSENFAVLLSEEPSPCASAPRRYFLMRSAYGLLTYIVSSRTVFFGSTSTRTWYSAPLYGMTQFLYFFGSAQISTFTFQALAASSMRFSTVAQFPPANPQPRP